MLDVPVLCSTHVVVNTAPTKDNLRVEFFLRVMYYGGRREGVCLLNHTSLTKWVAHDEACQFSEIALCGVDGVVSTQQCGNHLNQGHQ